MEQIVLDHPAVAAAGREALYLHEDPGEALRVPFAGIEWGDMEVTGYMAQAEYGEIPVDFRVPNRKPVIPLMVFGNGLTANVPNLISNPGFEVDASAWQTSGTFLTAGATLTQIIDTGEETAGQAVLPASSSRGIGINMTVVAGQQYAVRLRIRQTAGGSALNLHVAENAGPNENLSVNSNFTPGTTYADVTGTFTPTRAGSYFLVIHNNAATATTFFVDKVLVAPTSGAVIPAYFDGDSLDARWDGTHYLSTSTRIAGLSGIRRRVEQKVALVQREGGTLTRILANGNMVHLDIVNATLGIGGDTWAAIEERDIETKLALETLPDWYGNEELSTSATETANPELKFMTGTIKGDYPGRARLQVTNNSTSPQNGCIFAVRSRYYDSSNLARPWYDAEELTPLSGASAGAATGAASGNAVLHSNLGANTWTGILNTNLNSDYLAHKGTYRVFARVLSPQSTAVSLRLVYDVGDMTLPSENSAVTLPNGSGWFWVDLGTARLLPPPDGLHRWQGRIDGRGTGGGEDVYIDRIWFFNSDESMGILRAPLVIQPDATLIEDGFSQSAGVLAGKSAGATGASSLKYAGAGSNVAAGGSSAWASPSNVVSSNDLWAKATFASIPGHGTSYSDYLRTASHGFAIPAGAIIEGIKVEIERLASNITGIAAVQDESVRLLKAGSPIGNAALPVGDWAVGEQTKVYGSSTSKWGTTWTVAEINAANFGAQLRAKATNGLATAASAQAWVDAIRITVYYTPSTGDVWAGAGDADDFSVHTDDYAYRTAVSDSATTNGRFETIGSTVYSDVMVEGTFWRTSGLGAGTFRQGVLLRYVDTSNWLMAVRQTSASGYFIALYKRVAGVETLIGSTTDTWPANWPVTVRAVADSAGRAFVYYNSFAASLGDPAIAIQDADLATGGALDDGKAGLYDVWTGSTVRTGLADSFRIMSLDITALDAVTYPGQDVQISHEGAFRLSSDGAAYGPVSDPKGDNLRLPPSGLEGRKAEVMVKLTRSDLTWLPDGAVDDDLAASLYYRPCYLFTPEAL